MFEGNVHLDSYLYFLHCPVLLESLMKCFKAYGFDNINREWALNSCNPRTVEILSRCH